MSEAGRGPPVGGLSNEEIRLIIKGLEALCICEFDVPGASRLLLKLEKKS